MELQLRQPSRIDTMEDVLNLYHSFPAYIGVSLLSSRLCSPFIQLQQVLGLVREIGFKFIHGMVRHLGLLPLLCCTDHTPLPDSVLFTIDACRRLHFLHFCCLGQLHTSLRMRHISCWARVNSWLAEVQYRSLDLF